MQPDCIKTTYALDRNGYAQVREAGKTEYHHRVVYCKANGVSLEAIRGAVVRHKCDNPACVNPEHLELGTHKDNTQDMMKRGRNKYWHRQGSKIQTAVLTELDVLAIRASSKTQVQLAKQYGVTQANISAIVSRKTWKHI